MDHYNFLKATLGRVGFKGTFFPKPDSPCCYIKGNNGPDGCAVFYDTSKYTLVKTEQKVLEVFRCQSNQVRARAAILEGFAGLTAFRGFWCFKKILPVR